MLGIYTRISGNKATGKDTSIEIQTSEGIKVAIRLGMKYKIYSDVGISGTTEEIEGRPSFAEMMKDIDKDKITAVYVFDQSRLERNSKIWQIFQYQVNKKDVKFYPKGVETDLTDPAIKFVTGIQSLANQLFAEQTREKVNLTFDKRASEGKTHGALPYGYEKGADGMYQIIETEADVVRRIFDLSLAGNGTYTIANILNADNIPTKFQNVSKKDSFVRYDAYTGERIVFNKASIQWRGNVIYDMLKNTVYKGIRVWNRKPKGNKQRIEANVPPIVTEDLFDKVNRNLVNNKQKVGKRSEFKYLLNGLIVCGHCGKEYRGKKRIVNKDSAYKCIRQGKCPESRGISITRFENFIIQHLFINKNLKDLLLDLPINNSNGVVLKDKLCKYEEELKKKIKLKEKHLNWLDDEELENDESIREQYKKNLKVIDNLKNNIEILKLEILESDSNFARMKVESAVNEYKLTAGFDDTKRLIHSLVERITINHTKLEKGGYFYIFIKYKGFEEYSAFITDWFSVKWDWMYYARGKATNEAQRLQDIEDQKAVYDFKGIEYTDEDFIDYEASESVTRRVDEIILDNNNLVTFN
ncbi:recombinase family protein [Flavobacterium piscis]|uniref:DNA invertase Pin-like site-specific DNA recombinase n=1 Tax=Flavobacterium piscis TaxID=1114874 RepID=A0ABU1Y9T6_9FLAO|nr:recombinase family protein [Flavobacterium piscis]MDR7210913.1 DNA invertase Pin-like site-specific DNA recombinase [Flavobacterium piscis]